MSSMFASNTLVTGGAFTLTNHNDVHYHGIRGASLSGNVFLVKLTGL